MRDSAEERPKSDFFVYFIFLRSEHNSIMLSQYLVCERRFYFSFQSVRKYFPVVAGSVCILCRRDPSSYPLLFPKGPKSKNPFSGQYQRWTRALCIGTTRLVCVRACGPKYRFRIGTFSFGQRPFNVYRKYKCNKSRNKRFLRRNFRVFPVCIRSETTGRCAISGKLCNFAFVI